MNTQKTQKTATIEIVDVAPGVASVYVYATPEACRLVAQAGTCQVIGQTNLERAKTAATRAVAKLSRAGYTVHMTFARSSFPICGQGL